LDAAIGVISCAVLRPISLVEVMERLVLKSLLSVEHSNVMTRYRFLNTTRAYALEKLELSGLLRVFEMRYARYGSLARWGSGRPVSLQLVEQTADFA
jgi:predicted ATPase